MVLVKETEPSFNPLQLSKTLKAQTWGKFFDFETEWKQSKDKINFLKRGENDGSKN